MSQKFGVGCAAPQEKQGLPRMFSCFNVCDISSPHPLYFVACKTDILNICSGFRLPASHVIHTVGPIYDAHRNPEAYLRSAYRYFFFQKKFIRAIVSMLLACVVI